MKKHVEALFNRWALQPKWILVSVGVLLVLMVGLVDVLLPVGLSASILYLIPIACLTWLTGRRTGFLLSLLAAIVTLIGHLAVPLAFSRWIIFCNAAIDFGVFIIVSHLLASLKFTQEQEQRLTRTDALTGAVNQQYFLELTQMELLRAKRHGYPLTLALIDVRDFQRVSDRYGTSAGESLLCLISQVAHLQTRKLDVFARTQEAEFALLLPQTNYSQAQIVLHRLQERLTKTLQSGSFPGNVCMGAVTFTVSPSSVESLMETVSRLLSSNPSDGEGLRHFVANQAPLSQDRGM